MFKIFQKYFQELIRLTRLCDIIFKIFLFPGSSVKTLLFIGDFPLNLWTLCSVMFKNLSKIFIRTRILCGNRFCIGFTSRDVKLNWVSPNKPNKFAGKLTLKRLKLINFYLKKRTQNTYHYYKCN